MHLIYFYILLTIMLNIVTCFQENFIFITHYCKCLNLSEHWILSQFFNYLISLDYLFLFPYPRQLKHLLRYCYFLLNAWSFHKANFFFITLPRQSWHNCVESYFPLPSVSMATKDIHNNMLKISIYHLFEVLISFNQNWRNYFTRTDKAKFEVNRAPFINVMG